MRGSWKQKDTLKLKRFALQAAASRLNSEDFVSSWREMSISGRSHSEKSFCWFFFDEHLSRLDKCVMKSWS